MRSKIFFFKELKKLKKGQDSLLRELEELKRTNKEMIEQTLDQGKKAGEEQQASWRRAVNDPEVKDAMAATSIVSLPAKGVSYLHTVSSEELTDKQQKALINEYEISYAIIEQQNNNCFTMDYWSKTEQNTLFKLKREEIKRTWWNKFWNFEN